MEKVIKIYDSFEDQEYDDVEYWKNLDPNKKVEILESIRVLQMEINGECEQGFQRVLRITERT